MNQVSEDEKRGTGFSSEETRSLWKRPTPAEGHAACSIPFHRLQAACASASQHAPDQAEVTTSSITDLISHLVVAEAVDLDGLRTAAEDGGRSSNGIRVRRPEREHGDPPYGEHRAAGRRARLLRTSNIESISTSMQKP
jgi:hypothetical protein